MKKTENLQEPRCSCSGGDRCVVGAHAKTSYAYMLSTVCMQNVQSSDAFQNQLSLALSLLTIRTCFHLDYHTDILLSGRRK